MHTNDSSKQKPDHICSVMYVLYVVIMWPAITGPVSAGTAAKLYIMPVQCPNFFLARCAS